MRVLYFLIFILGFFTLIAGKDRIFINRNGQPLTEKEAVLILPGFGSKIYGTEKIADFFFNGSYDVFIPDYIARTSIEACVHNLEDFITKYKLRDYKKIHVFSYIVGAWTLNRWIMKNAANNIASIVYDRSPLQERAPLALTLDIPLLIRLVSGKIMKEFSHTVYPSIPKEKKKIGIIIEGKATRLVRKHKKSALSTGPVFWEPDSLRQERDDYLYTWLNHDDMYTRFDVIGEEILYFFGNAKFSVAAKRDIYTEDPFIPYNEKK